MNSSRQRARGFTLVEILVTVVIVGIVMISAMAIFTRTIDARESIATFEEQCSVGPRVIDMLERDLRSIWHYNVKNNRVLLGQNRDIASTPTDRIDMLCALPTAGVVRLEDGSARQFTLAEVGWRLKESKQSGLFELWRREDPLFDEEPWKDGNFQLVCDRVRSFNLTYYDTLGKDAKPLDDWDSERAGTLPRRVRVTLEIERKSYSRSTLPAMEVEELEGLKVTYDRQIVFDQRLPDILSAGVAMVPVRPMPPEAENTKVGPLGGSPGDRQRGRGGKPGEDGKGTPGFQRGAEGGPGGGMREIPGGGGNMIQFPGGPPGGIDLGRIIGGLRGGGGGGGGAGGGGGRGR